MILVPDTTTGGAYAYRRYLATDLFGFNRRVLRQTQNFGLAPLHFIVQRGPYQDGDTALDMRLDPRVIRLVIAETLYRRDDYWDRRSDVLDLLRPNRSFDGTVRPLVYQKWLPGGKLERRTDLVTTAWSTTVTSATGRFVERGLAAGDAFDITSGSDQGRATVASVVNDYTITLTTPMGHTATAAGRGATCTVCCNAAHRSMRGQGQRRPRRRATEKPCASSLMTHAGTVTRY
jgi:hypothetical protein